MKKTEPSEERKTTDDIIKAIENAQVNIVYEIARLEIEHNNQIEFLKQESTDLNDLRRMIVQCYELGESEGDINE